MFRLSCAIPILATQLLALAPFVVSIRRGSHRVQYARQSVDVLFRLVDTNRDAIISGAEADAFLSQPGSMLPSALRLAFTEEQRQQADTDFDQQLDQYEMQEMIEGLTGREGNILAITLIQYETEHLINTGVISVPRSSEEIAKMTVAALDTNGNGKISQLEAYAYYNVIATDVFWQQMKRLGEEVDLNNDRELNHQELIRYIQLAEERHGPLTYTPLVIYNRIVSLLGEFPNVNN